MGKPNKKLKEGRRKLGVSRQIMLSKSKQYYDENLISKFGKPIGASLSDIDKIEHDMGLSFPESLKQYLLWAGKHSKGPLIGTDCFNSDMKENTEYLPEFFEENNLVHPQNEKFVAFYSHQGYVLAWVYLTGEDDPVVYYFAEGSTDLIDTVNSIDEWFYEDLAGLH
jgi:SMI1 / KNR4 family (SUKH-1)